MNAGKRITTTKMLDRGTAALVSRTLAIVLMAMGIGMAGTALAQEPENVSEGYKRFAFEAADTDGDGRVSEAELARDAAAGFSGLDADRSGTLTPDELGPHDPARFSKVDADGDGKLTFIEVMNHKTKGLEKGDNDKDGYLSYEEMDAAVEAEAKE